MRAASLIAFAVLTAVVPTGVAQDSKESKGYRIVGIPGREHGYGNFETQVIASAKDLDAFLKKVEGQQGWNDRAAFLKGIAAGKVDFDKEALVLIRQTEGSGSNKVGLAAPELKGDKLVATLNREVAGIGTADIADYCFAVAVEKGKVKTVEVWVVQKDGPKPEKARDILLVTPK